MKSQIVDLLNKITNLDKKLIENKLEIPKNKDMGDFAFPCFLLSKEFKKAPNIIAEGLEEKIKNENHNFIKKIKAVWPYLNFFLSNEIYSELFKNILNENLENSENKNKTIVIDYIGANVWKPLHIGHMCTPNLWQTIINIYKKLWYNVISDSHIGDWWIIFWKLIVAYKNWWNEKELKENAVEHLFQLYIKATAEEEKNPELNNEFQEAFKKLAEWNEKYVELWALFTKESIKSANNQLSKLNVKPNYNIWESFYEWLNLPKLENYPDLIWSMKDIVQELIEKKIATKNEDNSVWVIFPEEKLPSCVLQKRNGTHGYLASDLAAIKYRVHSWKPEKIIYFVDLRQSLHLKQAFEISNLAWWLWNTKLVHAWNGFVKLKDGAMSSRKWKIIKLQALLDEATSRAKNIIQEKRQNISENELNKLGEIIWIWAIKYEYLRKNRELDIVFDWDQFMTFEGNSAPYIMYSYVRWLSILNKKSIDLWNKKDKHIFTEQKEIELIKQLVNYKNTLEETINKNYPHILANYTYELTKLFNNFYNNISVLNEENEVKRLSRLNLIKKTTDTIKDSFNLLWINLPEKM